MKRAIRVPKPRLLRWFLLTTPAYATSELWDRWFARIEKRYPLRFLLQYTIPRIIRRKLVQIKSIYNFIRVRTVNKYHVLNLKKTLKPGWHDEDTIMLHANFHILTKFVEEGLAWKNYYDWKKEKGNKWKRFDKEARIKQGLAMAAWYIEEKHEVETYQTIIRLYQWWTIERPQRINFFTDQRFWDEDITLKKKKVNNNGRWSRGLFSPMKQSQREKYALFHNTEEFYAMQDQSMLEKLISIRRGLWS